MNEEPAFWRLKWVLLAPLLGLVLLGHGFGAVWPNPPSGQLAQMWSQVVCDPKLTDSFFESDEESCPDGSPECAKCKDGAPVLKHTAKCFSTSSGVKHSVRFCEARLLDLNTIELLIHDSTPAFIDKLNVRIKKGRFMCRYWTS